MMTPINYTIITEKTLQNEPENVTDEWLDAKAVVFRIASEGITKADADIFVNDIENSGIGSSVASFETIEEAINDIL